MLTIEDVQKQIDAITAIAYDDEVAHSREDELHQSVLQAIADGKCKNVKECARLALTTKEMDFVRWCA